MSPLTKPTAPVPGAEAASPRPHQERVLPPRSQSEQIWGSSSLGVWSCGVLQPPPLGPPPRHPAAARSTRTQGRTTDARESVSTARDCQTTAASLRPGPPAPRGPPAQRHLMRRSRQHILSAAFCCARKNRSTGRRQTIRATFPRRFSDTKMGEKKKIKKERDPHFIQAEGSNSTDAVKDVELNS